MDFVHWAFESGGVFLSGTQKIDVFSFCFPFETNQKGAPPPKMTHPSVTSRPATWRRRLWAFEARIGHLQVFLLASQRPSALAQPRHAFRHFLLGNQGKPRDVKPRGCHTWLPTNPGTAKKNIVSRSQNEMYLAWSSFHRCVKGF